MAVSAGELNDDRALVFAVQQGDVNAYGALFQRHYPAVRKACARRLGNMVEGDEVAQAAFVRALERIQQCQGDRRFGPWVHVIARYLCIDTIRARSRVTPEEEPVSASEASGGLPEDDMLDRERRRNVHLALAQLPDRQRDVVIARTFENRRPVEIAAALGLSVAAVDSLLLRARRGLALAYERVAGEGGAAATFTNASAASALGGTLAVGPGRVVDSVASAGQAITTAAGDMASTAASLPSVKGIGAGVASAVMAVSLAFTGSVPASAPAQAPPVAVQVAPPSGSGFLGADGTPGSNSPSDSGRPGPLAGVGSVADAVSPSGALNGGQGSRGLVSTSPPRPTSGVDVLGGLIDDGLVGNGSVVESLVSPPRSPSPNSSVPRAAVPEVRAVVDGVTSALGGGLGPSTGSPGRPGLPAVGGLGSLPSTVGGAVDDVTGTVGLDRLVASPRGGDTGLTETLTTLVAPPATQSKAGDKTTRVDKSQGSKYAAKSGRPDPAPGGPLGGLTGAVGDLVP